MNAPLLIAKTKERVSYIEDGVFWWKEYRVVQDVLTHDYKVEVRYLCRFGSGKPDGIFAKGDNGILMFTDPETTWTVWSRGSTPEAAIEDVMGDTDFTKAESLHLLHADAVAKHLAICVFNIERKRLTDRYAKAVNDLAEWKREQERSFHKRHGNKTGDAYNKAFEKAKQRLKPEHERLFQAVKDAKRDLDAHNAKEVPDVSLAS